MIFRIIIAAVITAVFSCSALSEQQHHNISVTICRAFPTGNLQIRGVSAMDNQMRDIIFYESNLSESVINRYLSLCLAAFSTGDVLRIDYLDCTGTSCSVTNSTTLNLQK